ncbi:MAG TPA: MBL fold metallo-hydrolase [Thermoanaerobaculia bacterium]|jgi:ribonuclease Z
MKDDFITIQAPHFTLEGRSRAGHETFFRVRELGVALDIGRGPDAVIPMGEVFITHAHLDHAAGMPFWAGQRRLQGLRGGTLHVPAEAAEDVRELLRIQEKLTGAEFEVSVHGMAAGDEVACGRRHVVRAHAAPHRVAARAYEFFERRHHLREEYAQLPFAEIARLRKEGTDVEEQFRTSILLYTGDTDRGIFETCEAVFRSEVLVVECSFLADGHQDRAARYRHIHVDDIADFADRFENELIVLTHFSRRYSHEEIRTLVKRRLPHVLRERIRLALPESFQRI